LIATHVSRMAEVLVLVDNVTDSLSTVPRDVKNEVAVLRKAGDLPMSAGEYRCCAHHGLSLLKGRRRSRRPHRFRVFRTLAAADLESRALTRRRRRPRARIHRPPSAGAHTWSHSNSTTRRARSK
jgi:hypothetical protein